MSLLERDMPLCRGCGCSNLEACAAGCFWAEPDLCSRCSAAGDEELAGEVLEDYFDEEDLG